VSASFTNSGVTDAAAAAAAAAASFSTGTSQTGGLLRTAATTAAGPTLLWGNINPYVSSDVSGSRGLCVDSLNSKLGTAT
jgi:hypothetical protein